MQQYFLLTISNNQGCFGSRVGKHRLFTNNVGSAACKYTLTLYARAPELHPSHQASGSSINDFDIQLHLNRITNSF